jgi:hypothetical protein
LILSLIFSGTWEFGGALAVWRRGEDRFQLDIPDVGTRRDSILIADDLIHMCRYPLISGCADAAISATLPPAARPQHARATIFEKQVKSIRLEVLESDSL